MASYTDSEREELQRIPVEDILKAFGKSTEHGRDNLYKSPFRDEATPSFHVSREGNRWYDFGMGKGGSSVTLVCLLLGCDGGKAYDFLASIAMTYLKPSSPTEKDSERRKTGPSKIMIKSAQRQFRDKGLISYAQKRGIGLDTLSCYCSEIHFTYEGHPGFRNSCIGFSNNSGGWVMRAPDVKKCTGNDITTVNIYGEVSDSATSPTGLIFEGFFDFLSYIEMTGEQWPKCDICVLNSVTNISKAHAWIRSHKNICTFFDNDDAGHKALQDIRNSVAAGAAGGITVNDWSILYKEFNDLNERLGKDAQEREHLTIQYQSLWNKTFQVKFRKD